MISSQVDLMATRINKELNCKIKLDWLNDCVCFFKNEEPQIPENKLYSSSLEQIFLETIENVCDPIIPNDFQTRRDIWTMNQSLFLQMNFIIEISESFYEQWRRLHDMKLDDVNETVESKTFKVKKKRCFKLTLTDGEQTIHAMELKPISCLNTKLTPGIKVKIIGPVKVSNKIILLEPNNIEIVGGEAGDLLINNAYENVLLRLMNQPLTTTPKTDYVEEKQNEANTAQTNNTRPPSSSAIDIIRPTPKADLEADIIKLSLEEIDMDIDIDMLDHIEAMEMENQRKTSHSSNENNSIPVHDQIDLTSSHSTITMNSNEPTLVENYTFNHSRSSTSAFRNVLAEEPREKPTLSKLFSNPWKNSTKSVDSAPENQNKKLKNTTLTEYFPKKFVNVPPKVQSKANELLIPDASMMNSILLDGDDECVRLNNEKRKSDDPIHSPIRNSKAARIESKPKATVIDDDYKYKIDNTYNFITIDQFKMLKIVDKLKRTFAVYASVERVVRIKVREVWLLEVQIKDEWSKNTIEIKFDDELVADFAGRTAKEMQLFNQKLKVQPQLQEDVERTLERINSTLQSGKFLMTIHMTVQPPNGYQISVSKIIKNTDDNKNVIKLKIREENCCLS